MAVRPLPPELISLVHHIELNKAGWWDKGIQQLLLATAWLAGRTLNIDQILQGVRSNFGITIDESKARAQIKLLCSNGTLVCPAGNDYKISERFLKNYEQDLHEMDRIQAAAKELFIGRLAQHCPTLDGEKTWTEFNEKFLLPLIREIGANTYKLLAEGTPLLHPGRFERFLKSYPSDLHVQMSRAAEEFLDAKNYEIRAYILRSLNAFFFIEAGSLKAETLDALNELSKTRPMFMVFVDTNFLFSILELISASDDAGHALLELIRQLSGRVTVKLFLLQISVDEARRKLIATKQNLWGVRPVANLAEAALRMKLDSIQLKFFEESLKRPSLTAEEYFEPYISDLQAIAKSKGIEILNEDFSRYKSSQKVIDDIYAQLRIEDKRYKQRAKNYDRLEHDMILFHAAQDRRPQRIESPLEAKCWVVTLDYRMLGFDRFKGRLQKKATGRPSVPLCVHPTTLIQMLQFWIPRTTEFEVAMLNYMKLPFLYQEFDPNAEKSP